MKINKINLLKFFELRTPSRLYKNFPFHLQCSLWNIVEKRKLWRNSFHLKNSRCRVNARWSKSEKKFYESTVVVLFIDGVHFSQCFSSSFYDSFRIFLRFKSEANFVIIIKALKIEILFLDQAENLISL